MKLTQGPIFLMWLTVFFSSHCLLSATLSFKQHGKIVAQFSLEELKQKIPAVDIPIFEVHADEQRVYHGFSMQKLLSLAYKKSWQREEEILFTCIDGYQPSIPVDKFERHSAFLVFGRKNGEFNVDNKLQNKSHVELGPFYLVWENMSNLAIRDEGADDWPYQIETIDLIRFKDKFPHIAPPASSGAEAKRGFLLFRSQCIKCHSINGEGGSMGQDLNYPVNVTQYWQPSWLSKWIMDPRSIRHNATMPAMRGTKPQIIKRTKEVITYLKIMAKNRRLHVKQVSLPINQEPKISNP